MRFVQMASQFALAMALTLAPSPEAAVAQRDMVNALAQWEADCSTGDAEACYFAGIIYAKGADVPQDYDKAVAYFQKACALNDAESCYMTGLSHILGYGVPMDVEKAREYAQRAIAIDPNHAEAKEFLGLLSEK